MAFQFGQSPMVGGGLFERLIRSTKRYLKKTLKLSKLNFEEMTTILAEVEAVLNSRPLTYLQPDSTDILTPSTFTLATGCLIPQTHELSISRRYQLRGQDKEFKNSTI